jgi:glycine betaine/proline transport system substrate-binding protein
MATVWTVTAPKYAEQLPERWHRLADQPDVHRRRREPDDAAAARSQRPAFESARQWLKDHPEDKQRWLEGVTTFDGKPAAENLQLTSQITLSFKSPCTP